MKSNTNDSPKMHFKHTRRPGFLFGMLDFFTAGLLLFGPGVSTGRFFRTLNRIEAELNRRNEDVVS